MVEYRKTSPFESPTLQEAMGESDQDYERSQEEVSVKMFQELMIDPRIPLDKNVVKALWCIPSRHMVLGNIDEKTERNLIRQFRVMADWYLNTLDVLDAGKAHKDIDNLEFILMAALTRARGGFERKTQVSQLRENIMSGRNMPGYENMEAGNRGFMGKVKSLFGRRGG